MKLLKKIEVGKKDTASVITNVFLLLGIIILLISCIFSLAGTRESIISNQIISANDYHVEKEQDGSRTFIFDGKQIREKGNTLVFYTNHQNIEVLADDMLIYSVYGKKSSFGRTTGCRWNFIPIPENCQNITLHTTAIYSTNENDTFTFLAGNGNDILVSLLRKNIVSGFMSIFIVLLGICMIVSGIFVNKKAIIEKSLLYLGQFAVVIGLWSFGENDFSVLIIQNRTIMTFLIYILLILMPLPFIQFARCFMRVKKDRFWYILLYGIIINAFICIGLQLLQIKDMKETVTVTHVLLGISFIYMCYCFIINFHRRDLRKRMKVHLYGVVIIGISLGADLVTYYMRNNQIDSVGRIGFCIYVILLGIESAKSTLVRLEEGKKAEYYHKVAITDNLTGIYNRTAFDKEIKENIKRLHAAILFDLNNLKYMNDIYGHAAGDMYIIQASLIIKKAVSDPEHLYRIGGDEFCCILENMSKADFEKTEEKIRMIEKEYNAGSNQIKIHIACGFANNEIDGADKDIYELIKIADKRMYNNKRALKERCIIQG